MALQAAFRSIVPVLVQQTGNAFPHVFVEIRNNIITSNAIGIQCAAAREATSVASKAHHVVIKAVE
jgi:hypothetical protein